MHRPIEQKAMSSFQEILCGCAMYLRGELYERLIVTDLFSDFVGSEKTLAVFRSTKAVMITM